MNSLFTFARQSYTAIFKKAVFKAMYGIKHNKDEKFKYIIVLNGEVFEYFQGLAHIKSKPYWNHDKLILDPLRPLISDILYCLLADMSFACDNSINNFCNDLFILNKYFQLLREIDK